MLQWLTRYKNVLVPVSLWLFSLSFLSVRSLEEGKTKSNPFSRAVLSIISLPQKGISYSLRKIEELWRNYLYLVGTREENLQLKNKIAVMEMELQRLRAYSLENQRLKELLEFKKTINYRVVPALVIGEDITTHSKTITINLGKKDGLKPQTPVVSSKGIVGQILDEPGSILSYDSAQVLLIIDPTSRISVMLEKSREKGILQGTGDPKRVLLNYLPPESDVQPKDRIVTSGLGKIFPKELLVGEVIEVERKTHLVSPIVWVKPSVDFSRLEEVLVLLPQEEKE